MSLPAAVRACWRLVPVDMRWRWLALLPLAVVTVALEAAAALAVFALTRVIANPSSAAAMPVVAGLARATSGSDRDVILVVAVATALVYLVKNAVAVLTALLRSWCVEHATAATATALLGRYLAAPWPLLVQRNSAELIYTADQAVQRVYGTVLSAALAVATEALVATGIVAMLVVAAPGTTVVAGGLLAVAGWLFVRGTRRQVRAIGARLDVVRARSLRQLQHALGATREIAILGRARFFVDGFAADQAELADIRTRHDVLAELPRLVVEATFVGTALVVVVVATSTAGAGVESLPVLSLFAYAGLRVIPSVNRIVWQLSELRFGMPAVERVARDLALPAPLREPGPAPARGTFMDRIELDEVVLVHPGAARAALSGIRLVVRRGESLGIVGPTGAGKSTLVDLLTGLLDPTSGRVRIDGVDLRTRRAAWQASLGYVPQAVFLLDDTVRANVALGLAPQEVDEQRMAAAIARAQLGELVARLPAGLDTVIGERGARLSGGERQRVGIARALYREPDVLVLDEATAALDTQTEAELTRALAALHGDTTLVMVAHRLSSVRHCDRLVVLEEGRIADVGTWDELLARSERFRALARAGAVD
ncbi:ABC transporter ATP-binding protein/permease [Candidatus Binatia bacterium]|nr:ABC transporter ATP-binding protein/permease [Candidatus Binatia bacterium]